MMFGWRWDIAWPDTLLKAPLASQHPKSHPGRGAHNPVDLPRAGR
jgi:hypothetical protein